MCVIILKKPGIVIPFEKIEAACEVNSDGYGVSILNDNKTLTTYKEYNVKGNNPKELYDIIEKHNSQQQYIHLRFTTEGEKTLKNCHPFNILQDKNFEVNLMHNGTLRYHGLVLPKGYSDTRAFAEGPGKKYTELLYKVFGEEIVNEPDYQELMNQYLENKWYFLTYDNLGNYSIQGKDQGTWMDDDTWWASNTYSFNETHRKKSYSYSNYSSCYQEKGFEKHWPSTNTSHNKNLVVNNKTPFLEKEEKPIGKNHTDEKNKALGYALIEAKKRNLNYATHTPPEERPTFCDLTGIDNIRSTFILNEMELEDIVSEVPEAAVILMMDLIHEIKDQDKRLLALSKKAAA